MSMHFRSPGLVDAVTGHLLSGRPRKFKEELNIRNRDARTEQVEGSQQGEGALNDILNGFLDGLLHEDEADKSSGKDGEDTAGTRDEPQKMSRKQTGNGKPQQQGTIPLRETPQVVRAAGRPCLESKLWGAPRSGDAAKR